MPKRNITIKQAPIVEQFATRLRQIRCSRGMTQAEVARRSRVAVSYVWKLESGTAAPGIDLVSRLAGALGTTVHDLLPVGAPPDSLEMLRHRARDLLDNLLQSADEPTLTMLCPLLARLGESPTRRR